jgi:RNA polymerase sigma factor (sigma-70 family)
MATNQMSGFIQRLRSVLRDGAGPTDGQLLGDYLSRRDEAAVAALVRRHGPMVWGVCRRVLRNHHDAEDAFQTTFLVLVRKAASIASRELLANWLYGVAHQTALKARATAAKRKGRERQATEMPEPTATQQDQWHDLQPLLDEELSRLPAKYRSVVVLCDLKGKTRRDAAAQLGCPEGTVASRLVRARTMLAKRLTRRGVALSGGALAAVLSQQAASAGVPASVASSTIKAASLLAAGKAAATGAISVKVAALTEGVMKAMLVNKLKTVIAVVLVLGFVATGATVLTCRTAAGREEKPAAAEKPVKPENDKPKALKDEDAMQGTWHVVAAESGGDKVLENTLQTLEFRVVFKGNKMTALTTFTKTPEGFEVSPPEWTFVLDEKTSPKQIDMTDDGGKWMGIYAFEQGALKICVDQAGKDRPTSFKTKKGTDQCSLIFHKKETENENQKGDDVRTSLEGAVKSLNKKAAGDAVGKYETPITEQEVIAVIRATQRPKDSALTDKVFDAFKKIAETKQMPPGAELEFMGGIHDPGASFIYDVWWVRVRMPKESGGTYSFAIRERILRSRTLQEEMARLEMMSGEELIDNAGTQEHFNDLKDRIEKMKTK